MVIKTDKVRADTTVLEADVCYPTDSGLLAERVAKQARLGQRLALRIRTRTGR